MIRSARWLLVVVTLTLAVALLALNTGSTVGAAPSAQPTPIPTDLSRKLEPALLKQLLAQKEGLTPFIAIFRSPPTIGPAPAPADTQAAQRVALVTQLQSAADRAQVGARAVLTQRQMQNRAAAVRPLWIINAIAAQADRATILELAARPEVELIRADHVRRLLNGVLVETNDTVVPPDPTPPLVRPPSRLTPDVLPLAGPPTVEWNILKIKADQVWNALNLDGSGVVVANLDTGVDWLHPALQSKYRGYRGNSPAIHSGNWFDATGSGYVYPGDGHGHGTHTMGSLVGSTAEHVIGVAPGARWIAAKIFTNSGFATDAGIHNAFQWILAPDGDPLLAPDILSNSWGTDNGFDTTFLNDVRAIRAFGILPIFSNGNNGYQGSGTVGAPGSFSEAFAVGATDQDDVVAAFSSRGPSPLTGNIKPDIAAPGVNIASSYPGGGYALLNGTSMATPQVAGIAALLRQAKPSITLTETMFAITSTAIPLGSPIPNNNTGWGRVDAYAATLNVTANGILTGTITTSGAPLAGAQIVATDRISRTTQTFSDAAGHYHLPLSADLYTVSVFAFGYQPTLNNSVIITTLQVSTFNADLSVLPTAVVRGQITDLSSGAPLSATISALDTPATVSSGLSGSYALTLPVGTYTLRAASWLHRILTSTVTLQAGDILTRDFALPGAPSILLLDSGAWYYDSQISYYQNALDSLGYLYQKHSVAHPILDSPTITLLRSYSLTIWSSPQDSPDYVGAGSALTQYLDGGGRLFLSGQDIAFWDGGGPGFGGYDYFPNRLHGAYVADTVSSPFTRGSSDEALQGITLTLNYTDSAINQLSPDQVAPLNDNARPLAFYAGGEIAGLAVSTCLPYRAAYLAFGLEGVGPASARREAVASVIDWLSAPAPLYAFSLSSDPRIAVGLPGSVVTHALSLRNVGQLPDTYTVTLTGNDWPFSLFHTGSAAPLAGVFTLPSCASQGISINTTIPANTPRNISDTATLSVRAQVNTAQVLSRTLLSKTPAPVLLVDDDRWYPQETHYTDALAAAAIAFDTYDTHGAAGPSTAYMQMYPQVAWFSAYDWLDPLNASDEANLAAYMNSGGRLFYTSQDYLAVRFNSSSFARNYLGVLDYTNDITVTTVQAAPGNPFATGLGAYTLTYPYMNFSDYLTPTVTATVAFIGNGAAPAALSMRNPHQNSKSVFFAFPFETIADNQQPSVIAGIVGWLGPLGDIAPAAPTIVMTNSLFTFELPLVSSHPAIAAHAQITVTLPAELTPVTLGDPALSFDGPSHSIRFNGVVTPTRVLTWTVQLNPSVPPGTLLTTSTVVRDLDEGITSLRLTRTLVGRTTIYLPIMHR